MANDYLCRFVKKKADFHSEKKGTKLVLETMSE